MRARRGSRPAQNSAIVIGAGLSGLACARELSHLGWRVVVLEARDRAGGRVWTDNFLNGAPVDVGASFIHGIDNNPIAELALRAGVDLHERLTCPLFDADGSPMNPDIDRDIEQEFNDTLDRAANRKFDKSVPKEESLEEALEASLSKRKFTAREQRAFNWHLSNLEYSVNADLSSVRSNGWDADDPYGLEGAHCIVGGKRGMSAVVDRLIAGLAETDVRFEHRVRQVTYHASGVRVEVVKKISSGGANGSNQNGHSTAHHRNSRISESEPNSEADDEDALRDDEELTVLNADVCIATVPVGVLKSKSIRFIPDLPREKRAAISSMGFGLLNKISLLFPYKFWGDDCEIFGYCSEQRGELPIFVDLSQDGFPILCILVSGTPAEKLESDPFFSSNSNSDKLVVKCCDLLKKIFKQVPPVLETKVTQWRMDVFAQGSYSFVQVGSRHEDYDVLAAPVSQARHGIPRLFFAGEATNRFFPASVHGAFFSGIREAQRLNRWFSKNMAHCPTTDDSRMCLTISRESSITEEDFKELYAPGFTFENDIPSSSSSNSRGKVVLSKAGSEVADDVGLVPASPRARGKKGRSRNALGHNLIAARGSVVTFPLAKRPKLGLESLRPGDRIEVAWKTGKYFTCWISTLDREAEDEGKVIAGVYYDLDGSFELINLVEEKWRPCPLL